MEMVIRPNATSAIHRHRPHLAEPTAVSPQYHRLQSDPHPQTDQCLTPSSEPSKETHPNPAGNDPVPAIRLIPTHLKTGSCKAADVFQQTASGLILTFASPGGWDGHANVKIVKSTRIKYF
jgi:hypothetical protein